MKEKKNIPTKKDGRRDIDKVRIILTMFYSDGLIWSQKKLEVDKNERKQENEKWNQEASSSLIGKEKILIIKIL